MRNILRRLVRRHQVFLLTCSIVLAAFQFLLCAIVASIDLGGAMQQVLAFAPPVMRAMIEQSMVTSPQGMLAFGWGHPITHALMTAVAISLAARAIAGEIEGGVIELVLAQPISRGRYFASHAAFGLFAIAAVAGAGILGSVIGRHVFGVASAGAASTGRLFANLVLLQAAIYAVTLVFSSFGRETGQVALAGVLVAVVSYLIDVISTLWPKAAFMHPYSLHAYYDPRGILVEGHALSSSIPVLGAIVVVCGSAALVRFRARDLP
jgi:beta-exotoxin I transport system permease protein